MASVSVPGVETGQASAFPAEEYERRQTAVRRHMEAAGIEVLLVTGPENIFYLTGQQTPGYTTFQALLLPLAEAPVFIVRQLELANFISNTFLTEIEVYQDNEAPSGVLVRSIESHGWSTRSLGVDKSGYFMPVAFYEQLEARFAAQIRDGSGLVERERIVKSPLEQERVRRAATYVDAAQRAAIAALPSAETENDVVSAMVAAAIAAGGEYVGMEPLVSAGKRTGVPHHTWRRAPIAAGDNLILEPACCHDRYHAVLMRSAVVGQPSDDFRRMYDVALEGLQATLDAVKPGNTCEDAHVACQKVVDKAGLTDSLKKKVGYSIGIAFAPGWDEGGLLGMYFDVKVPLQPGMCFHIPVALRNWGHFTVGVSESIIVTESGYDVLGTIPRDLILV